MRFTCSYDSQKMLCWLPINHSTLLPFLRVLIYLPAFIERPRLFCVSTLFFILAFRRIGFGKLGTEIPGSEFGWANGLFYFGGLQGARLECGYIALALFLFLFLFLFQMNSRGVLFFRLFSVLTLPILLPLFSLFFPFHFNDFVRLFIQSSLPHYLVQWLFPVRRYIG